MVIITEENKEKPVEENKGTERTRSKNRNSRSRLSIPNGLSNIKIEAELAEDIESPPMVSSNNNKKLSTPANENDYPLALPAIPQASSINHIVDASKTPSDITNKHEKKKSITQLHLQDLELDRKFVQESKSKRKSSSTTHSHTSLTNQPLTPLAMMTQIGLEMPDIGDINLGTTKQDHNDQTNTNTKQTSLSTKSRSSDYKLADTNDMILMSTSVSVPSPPSLNNGAGHTNFQISQEYEADDYNSLDMNDDNSNGIKPNSRRITPKAIGSEEYINIFNEEQKNVEQFKFDIENKENRGSRESRNSITDINYKDNHKLPYEINRKDSSYKGILNANIDTILQETQLIPNLNLTTKRSIHKYVDSMEHVQTPQKSQKSQTSQTSQTKQSTPVMISPQGMNIDLHNLNYAFDQFSHFSHKTPVIMSDEDDDNFKNGQHQNFEKIQETILIIKKDGEEYINDILNKLTGDNEFYINEFREIQRKDYYKMSEFLVKMQSKKQDLNHSTNADIKSVILLFNELLLNDSFSIIPLYRINAINYLYECISKYQSLKLLDDECSINTVNLEKIDSTIKDSKFDFHAHLKKPTDELQVLDNIHFDDYDEYPSDEVDNVENIDNFDNINDINISSSILNNKKVQESIDGQRFEEIRQWFAIHNVYAPNNFNQYDIIKQILCPNTNLIDDNNTDKYHNRFNNKYKKYMESIAIIKPNVINDCGDLIRATFVGNGFIISSIKAQKFKPFQSETIINSMDSYHYYQTKDVKNEAIRYLSSGTIIVMIIKKPIGIDGLTEKDCFNKLSQLIGFVDPELDRKNNAETQSIRGCFGEDLIHNAIDVTMTKQQFITIKPFLFPQL